MQSMVRCWERAELWALTMALASLTGSSTIHSGSTGILDGLWRREEGCIGQRQKDADP